MNELSSKRRVVAIVGRPNVGKSAIFNRLVGRRVAIVHRESGVTRDRLLQRAVWEGLPYELVDTGGLSSSPNEAAPDPITSGIDRQVMAAMESAAVAILVVDAAQGLHPMDEAVAARLRRQGLQAFVAVNKCDDERHEATLPDFARLGLPLFPVSALHNRGFGDLMEPVLDALPAVEPQTEFAPLRVAVVGRPNVGKSSFINRILGDERVLVSEIPGTTRDRIEIPFSIVPAPEAVDPDTVPSAEPAAFARHYLLIDTAGMRKMGRIHEAVERYSHFRAEDSIRDADVVVLLIDASQGPTDQDKHIAAAIVKSNKGCLLAANKWDLVQELKPHAFLRAVNDAMPFMTWCPSVCVSAATGFNVRHCLGLLDTIATNLQATLPTGLLNRTLGEAVRRVSPPQSSANRLKLFYAAQVGTAPIRIRIFCNDPKRIRPNYREYLTRFFRQAFDLRGAPLVLQFRGRHDKSAPPPETPPSGKPRRKPPRA